MSLLHFYKSKILKLKWAAARQNQQNDVRLAKTQISLGICPVWSESLLCALWVDKDLSFPHVESEGWSD